MQGAVRHARAAEVTWITATAWAPSVPWAASLASVAWVAGVAIVAWVASVALTSAQAQNVPDAGTLLQQFDRHAPDARRSPTERSPLQPGPAPPPPATGGPSIVVRAFRFDGNTLLPDEALQARVQPWLTRPLDLAGLREVAQAVASAYREAGWVVRADLPRQDVTDGIVTIRVDEAVRGEVRIAGEPPTRVQASRVIAMVDAQQPRGTPLGLDALDRALLLIGDLPGVSATGHLSAGRGPRETDVGLVVVDGPRWQGGATLDNRGSRATGRTRLDGQLAWNAPRGAGDQFAANVVLTEGSRYTRLGYTWPLGAAGWRLGINASRLNYDLIGAEYRALDARGSATGFGLDASYPLIRATRRNLALQLGAESRRFDNQAAGITTSRYGLRTASIGLAGQRFDDFGGGVNAGSASVIAGDFDDRGQASTRLDGSDDGWRKLRLAASRQQSLGADLSLVVAWNAQFSDRNLDSAERFYLGGAGGVRAYPASEGAGAQGWLLNVELRRRLPHGLALAAFYDHGRVTRYRDANARDGTALVASGPNRYGLAGYGLSLAWAPGSSWSMQATWARRAGSNPNPTAAGTDQDGSFDRDRFWLAVSFAL